MELIFVEWRDAYDHDEVGWLKKEAIDKIMEADALMQSVGWLYHEDDRYVTIVGDYEKGADNYSRITRIPVGMITQRIPLTPILGRK
jgi:hypothetical protein